MSYVQKCIREYFENVFEVFIGIIIIQVAMEKPIDLSLIRLILFESFIIGLICLLLQMYSGDFKSSITQGITFTVGAQLAARFMDINKNKKTET